MLADTHGLTFNKDFAKPAGKFDLAVHCGDLTQESKLSEFRDSLSLLKDIDASLKLVIAGNHEITLDTPTFQRHLARSGLDPNDPAVVKEYGAPDEARALFNQQDDIQFLEEGTHTFTLANGAKFTIYASPWTPIRHSDGALGSGEAGWAFQYQPSDHDFDIQPDTDIVVTHGPPHGILDYVSGRRGGCSDLFAAIERSRPRLHCFGHIHASWGAKMVTWRKQDQNASTQQLSHFTAIDNDKSVVVEKLAGLKPGKFDVDMAKQEKAKRLAGMLRDGFCDVTPGDEVITSKGEHTMFVNAAVEGDGEVPIQPPMVLNLELPRI